MPVQNPKSETNSKLENSLCLRRIEILRDLWRFGFLNLDLFQISRFDFRTAEMHSVLRDCYSRFLATEPSLNAHQLVRVCRRRFGWGAARFRLRDGCARCAERALCRGRVPGTTRARDK